MQALIPVTLIPVTVLAAVLLVVAVAAVDIPPASSSSLSKYIVFLFSLISSSSSLSELNWANSCSTSLEIVVKPDLTSESVSVGVGEDVGWVG